MATYITSNRSTSHRTRREVSVVIDREYGELFIHDTDYVLIDGKWEEEPNKTIQLNFCDIKDVEFYGYHFDGRDRFKINLYTKTDAYHIPFDDMEDLMDLYCIITREVDIYSKEDAE
jgi:hypothetical protein